ncbi:MAG: AbrB family transcriptional regulator [Cyanobacteria bacterium J06598_3]
MVNDPHPEALTGKALLKKVKELGHLSSEEKAKSCGYFTVTKNGVNRVNMMKFLKALIEAEGSIPLDSTLSGNGRGGRSASYRITVQSNGNLLIGSAYTKQMGLQPGDEFEISLGRKHIRLTQLNNNSDEKSEKDGKDDQ